MEITNEMIEKSIMGHRYKGFTIINEDYILINGSKLDIELIEKTKRLREKGVNYCGPINYKEINGKIILLEYRAKGMEMDFFDSSSLGVLSGENYLLAFKNYMNVLQKLSVASLDQYLKFFNDIEEMKKVNIIPDVCSLSNLFYDEKQGFSFIDVYPGNKTLEVSDIFHILLNPKFSYHYISVLPEEYMVEYTMYMSNIYEKIIICLRKFNYPLDKIEEYLGNNVHGFSNEECIKSENIEEFIQSKQEENRGKLFNGS